MNDLYTQIAEKIIEYQESIIGPVAIEQASHVPNLKLDWGKHEVTISGNESHVIDSLVEVYKELFGQISVEASREAAGALLGQLPADKLPKTLAA